MSWPLVEELFLRLPLFDFFLIIVDSDIGDQNGSKFLNTNLDTYYLDFIKKERKTTRIQLKYRIRYFDGD